MNTPSRFLACPDNDKADDMNTQRVIRDIQTEGGKGCCKTLGDPQETGPTHLSYIPVGRPRKEGGIPFVRRFSCRGVRGGGGQNPLIPSIPLPGLHADSPYRHTLNRLNSS